MYLKKLLDSTQKGQDILSLFRDEDESLELFFQFEGYYYLLHLLFKLLNMFIFSIHLDQSVVHWRNNNFFGFIFVISHQDYFKRRIPASRTTVTLRVFDYIVKMSFNFNLGQGF